MHKKTVFNQMNSDVYNLAEPHQSAYREKYSTITALIKICNDVLLELDKRNVVLLTLLDLSSRI